MTIETEGIKFDEFATDPTTPENGRVWLNSTDDVARVRIGGATRPLNAFAMDICFASDADPWISMKSANPAVLARFLFKGTSALGTPKAIRAIVEQGAVTVSGQVTIYDATNALQIARATSGPGPDSVPTILDLGTLSNLPTGVAIFEVQVARTTGVANTRIGSLCVEF